jgi:hypothetical protein
MGLIHAMHSNGPLPPVTEEERVKLKTEEEKLCFKLINDLDHINGHVSGPITQKEYMRNEIWSLITSP